MPDWTHWLDCNKTPFCLESMLGLSFVESYIRCATQTHVTVATLCDATFASFGFNYREHPQFLALLPVQHTTAVLDTALDPPVITASTDPGLWRLDMHMLIQRLIHCAERLLSLPTTRFDISEPRRVSALITAALSAYADIQQVYLHYSQLAYTHDERFRDMTALANFDAVSVLALGDTPQGNIPAPAPGYMSYRLELAPRVPSAAQLADTVAPVPASVDPMLGVVELLSTVARTQGLECAHEAIYFLADHGVDIFSTAYMTTTPDPEQGAQAGQDAPPHFVGQFHSKVRLGTMVLLSTIFRYERLIWRQLPKALRPVQCACGLTAPKLSTLIATMLADTSQAAATAQLPIVVYNAQAPRVSYIARVEDAYIQPLLAQDFERACDIRGTLVKQARQRKLRRKSSSKTAKHS